MAPSVPRTSMIAGLVARATARAGWVALAGLALAGAAVVFAMSHFSLSTNEDDLLSPKLPYLQAETRLSHLFPGLDPQIVVVDEVIGQRITLAAAGTFDWRTWIVAFALFRLFDIWKPPPVRQLEHLRGGWGIIADDVMAGLYGALAIFVLDRLHLFSYGI